MAQAVAIIPARYGSTRFPGKPLASDTGQTLIQHVYERSAAAERVSRTIVATDDQRIFDAVRAFGGEVVMTRADHPNGTCRLAEVAEGLNDELIVNVQGDEPEIEPYLIDMAIDGLGDADVGTLASPFAPDEDPSNPNIVKVVVDQNGRALFFSRALIPHDRDGLGPSSSPARPLKHVGLYVYRREYLLRYVTLPSTPLERMEHLEQLRVLETGGSIAVVVANVDYHGIDTPEQYAAFVKRWADRQ